MVREGDTRRGLPHGACLWGTRCDVIGVYRDLRRLQKGKSGRIATWNRGERGELEQGSKQCLVGAGSTECGASWRNASRQDSHVGASNSVEGPGFGGAKPLQDGPYRTWRARRYDA